MAVINRPYLLGVLVALVAGSATAQDRAAASVMVTGDDDHVLVISPTVAGTATIGPVAADARVTLDLISAASVDLVTAASPGGFNETRQEVGVGLDYDFGGGHDVSAGYGYSHEPDYETHSMRVGHTIDLFDRRATFAASYGYGRSRVGRARDTAFEEHKDSHKLDAAWSHILTKTLVLDVGCGFDWTLGYNANPYRYVRLYRPSGGAFATAVPEVVPDERMRATLTARVRSRLVNHLFGIADYRFYGDTWGQLAHTLTLRLTAGFFDDTLALTVEGRATVQGAASFYQERYTTFPDAPVLRTADKELAPMWSALGGLHLEYSWTLPPGAGTLRVGVGADVIHFEYQDFQFLSGRTGYITTSDLTWEL